MSVCGICVGAPALLVGVERMGGGARGGVHRWVGWWVRGCALWLLEACFAKNKTKSNKLKQNKKNILVPISSWICRESPAFAPVFGGLRSGSQGLVGVSQGFVRARKGTCWFRHGSGNLFCFCNNNNCFGKKSIVLVRKPFVFRLFFVCLFWY